VANPVANPVANRFELHRLLWDLRRDPAVAMAWEEAPAGVLRRYDLDAEEVDAVVRRDFPALLDLGVSPMLLYFGALEMGVSRDAYYEALGRPPLHGRGGPDARPGQPEPVDAPVGDGR
jgi:hypothetical protein